MLVAALALASAAPADTRGLCGRGDARIGTAEFSVIISDQDPPERPYVSLIAPGSGNFRIVASYDATAKSLRRLKVVSLHARVLPGKERFVQLEWREAGAAEWFNEGYRFEPRVYGGEPLGSVDTRMGQGPPIAFRTRLLDALQQGTMFEVRSLTEAGTAIETGRVALPAPALVEKAFASAHAAAVTSLSPCAPPTIIRPLPVPRT